MTKNSFKGYLKNNILMTKNSFKGKTFLLLMYLKVINILTL